MQNTQKQEEAKNEEVVSDKSDQKEEIQEESTNSENEIS